MAIASAPRVVAMALVLAILLFFASETRILNAFRVDDYVGAALRLWTPAQEKTLDPNVAVILAGQQDDAELGIFSPAGRARHTDLLEGFTRAREKPSVVAIDIEFDRPGDQDDRFAQAINQARTNGIQVVGGQRVGDDGVIISDSKFNPTLKPAFGDSWGDVLVGGLMPLSLLVGQGLYVNEYEVASLPPDSDLSSDVAVVPSLAVKSVMQHYFDPKSPPQAYYNERAGEVIIKGIDAGKPIEKHIPVTRTDLRLNMILEYASKSTLINNEKQYRDVYKFATSNQEQDRAYLEDSFKRKIVIVGFDTPEDTHATIGDGTRSGVEYHANAISNILKGIYIREVSGAREFIIIVAMVALGVLLQTKLKRWLPGNRKLELPYIGEIHIPIALFSALILYLIIAYLVYSQARVTFDMSYHVAALLFGYWSTSIFHKQLRLAGVAGG
jgi:CHASE2 domain-containing sensor protein